MTPVEAIVATDSFQLGIEGNFFDNVYGEEYPTDTIPVMPYQLTGSAGFQAFVSGFTVDSLFQSALEEHKVGGWYNAADVPATSPW